MHGRENYLNNELRLPAKYFLFLIQLKRSMAQKKMWYTEFVVLVDLG